jgi:hypothetical protein
MVESPSRSPFCRFWSACMHISALYVAPLTQCATTSAALRQIFIPCERFKTASLAMHVVASPW